MRLRQEEPIADVGTLMQEEPFASLEEEQRQALSERLGVASEYFQIMVDVEVNGDLSRLVSRVRRRRRRRRRHPGVQPPGQAAAGAARTGLQSLLQCGR
ncbi:hypothetical protein ASALC70_04503 [Alcanivorax sp. ALC70]|nr:hypothetical protein ASALC70_04503 [Alcanivorax sp. ALC70]